MDTQKETVSSTADMGGNQMESDTTDHPVAPDQFDEKYRTTRMEIWAYYAWVDH